MPPLRTHDAPPQVLESDTELPSFPTLAIIAPTPRSFTFPVSHTLDAPTFCTPSTSPFEPELYSSHLTSPASSNLLTTPPLSRTLSPNPSVSSVSLLSIPSTSSGRKSASLDAERRPRKGDNAYIKRPENAFILFRRKCCAEEEASRQNDTKKRRQADLSKTISQQWKALSAGERQYWEDRADERKKVHQQMYPDYVYRPQRVRDQDGKARNRKYTKRKTRTRTQGDLDGVSAYVVPSAGRSTSAPTPPPSSYQTIHIPNIFPSYASSLLPMISQRTGYVGNADGIMANFDFYPDNIPAPHGNPHFEAGLQPSELHQDVFNFSGQDSMWCGNRGEAQLQPPSLNMGSLSISSSAASSPISGPFTPSSSVLSYPPSGFGGWAGAPRSDTWDFNQQMSANMDVQAGVPTSREMDGFFNPWDPSEVWQREQSVLLRNDFDLDGIPPIELKIPEYPDSAPCIGMPSVDLEAGGYPRELGDYSDASYGSEFWRLN
ncbi:hypothetical protein DFJ43DRAFT_1003239 [Lentinula guzmanii]|uniref:HMG box domain-containing protein n=1 Tax=Lentinula guzmanii TaxID=2804957 RepID=A0AA38JEG9_9AGAR|nr:hypothetical protein DFJ43DRAFT_1003239 [Lentinula guzmanii]